MADAVDGERDGIACEGQPEQDLPELRLSDPQQGGLCFLGDHDLVHLGEDGGFVGAKVIDGQGLGVPHGLAALDFEGGDGERGHGTGGDLAVEERDDVSLDDEVGGDAEPNVFGGRFCGGSLSLAKDVDDGGGVGDARSVDLDAKDVELLLEEGRGGLEAVDELLGLHDQATRAEVFADDADDEAQEGPQREDDGLEYPDPAMIGGRGLACSGGHDQAGGTEHAEPDGVAAQFGADGEGDAGLVQRIDLLPQRLKEGSHALRVGFQRAQMSKSSGQSNKGRRGEEGRRMVRDSWHVDGLGIHLSVFKLVGMVNL